MHEIVKTFIFNINITNFNVNLEVVSMYDLYLEVFCLFLRTMQYMFDILVWRVFKIKYI